MNKKQLITAWQKVVIKHRKFLGYSIAVIVSFILGGLRSSALVTFDMFILFGILRIAWLSYEINGAELNIFSYMFTNEDEDPLEDGIQDVLTDNYARIKEEISDILAKTEVKIGVFKDSKHPSHPLLVDYIIKRSKMKLEFNFLLWVIGISIFLILLGVFPFLQEILGGGGYE